MLQKVMSRCSVEFFWSHRTENFVEEPFCAVFQKSSGSEKVYGQEGGGEYQDFPSNFFGLTVPEIFVEESFTVAVISGT